jgi:hypothetical protein
MICHWQNSKVRAKIKKNEEYNDILAQVSDFFSTFAP